MVKLITPEYKVQRERIKWIISGLGWDNLSDWEQGFIESVEEQSNDGKMLSYKQTELLEKIYRIKGK